MGLKQLTEKSYRGLKAWAEEEIKEWSNFIKILDEEYDKQKKGAGIKRPKKNSRKSR